MKIRFALLFFLISSLAQAAADGHLMVKNGWTHEKSGAVFVEVLTSYSGKWVGAGYGSGFYFGNLRLGSVLQRLADKGIVETQGLRVSERFVNFKEETTAYTLTIEEPGGASWALKHGWEEPTPLATMSEVDIAALNRKIAQDEIALHMRYPEREVEHFYRIDRAFSEPHYLIIDVTKIPETGMIVHEAWYGPAGQLSPVATEFIRIDRAKKYVIDGVGDFFLHSDGVTASLHDLSDNVWDAEEVTTDRQFLASVGYNVDRYLVPTPLLNSPCAVLARGMPN